jgi:hypothetical protein
MLLSVTVAVEISLESIATEQPRDGEPTATLTVAAVKVLRNLNPVIVNCCVPA